MALYIGLMSGTSLDGVDGVLVDLPATPADGPLQVLAHASMPLPEALHTELLALNHRGDNELHRAAVAANRLALLYAQAIEALLAQAGRARSEVRAVGAHGQTVRHHPDAAEPEAFTCQLLNGALLAERCGIDVVCDLRSRDVAAGGQGAPLVPAFHAGCFGCAGKTVAVLNLGGISNLSLLHADGRIGGFDCGPGNALMDGWCRQHRGEPFDADGAWAASGRVDEALLATWLADPYFDRAPPKSTGRDLFDPAWLAAGLALHPGLAPADVQATLAELTARSCADALLRHAAATTRLLVCGGGALNGHLMRRLAARLPGVLVESSASAGLPPQQVEACAFAWLAQAFVERRPGNRPEVTGARGLRILGALHPAG